MFASIESNVFGRPDDLVAGSGVLSWDKVGEGHYQVVFDRDVTRCAAVASPSSHQGGTPAERVIGTSHHGHDPASANRINVLVQRFIASTGRFHTEDASFDLVVVC